MPQDRCTTINLFSQGFNFLNQNKRITAKLLKIAGMKFEF